MKTTTGPQCKTYFTTGKACPGCEQCAPAEAQPVAGDEPTDISTQLREYAGNPGYSHNDYADVMRRAADECDRFYNGMVAWKKTSEAKDATLAATQPAAASVDHREFTEGVVYACARLVENFDQPTMAEDILAGAGVNVALGCEEDIAFVRRIDRYKGVQQVALAANKPAAPAAEQVAPEVPEGLLSWAVERWNNEVADRPLKNVHRRTLDDTWRQVIRFAGGDPDVLVGPSHDELIAASPNTGSQQ